jgi:hypothetical protein
MNDVVVVVLSGRCEVRMRHELELELTELASNSRDGKVGTLAPSRFRGLLPKWPSSLINSYKRFLHCFVLADR